jgi:hypothetical protein
VALRRGMLPGGGVWCWGWLCLFNLQGGVIYDNGVSNQQFGADITSRRSADSFSLSQSAMLGSVRFWAAAPLTAVTWAIRGDFRNEPGPILYSGTVISPAGSPTGTLASCNCDEYRYDIELPPSTGLAAGNYWLELHEGASLTGNGGTGAWWSTAAGNGQFWQDQGLPAGILFPDYELAFQVFGAYLPDPVRIFSSGASDRFDGLNITGYRVVDEFRLSSAATVGGVRFAASSSIPGGFAGAFGGQVAWAIYEDAAGSPGALIRAGASTPAANVKTGQVHLCQCDEHQVDFYFEPLSLLAGTYWLELHEGSGLTADDGTDVYWSTAAAVGGRARLGALGDLPDHALDATTAFDLLEPAPEPGTLSLLAIGLVALWPAARSVRRGA